MLPARLPAASWGTKGFGFWTFLSLLLSEARPATILELGSGRSTICLGEYCQSFGASLTSIETERAWFDKAAFELRTIMASDSSVHLLAINNNTGWYDENNWADVVGGDQSFDLVFIDAPNHADGSSHGMRDSPTGLRHLREACTNASIVIIDDVHRAHILGTVDAIIGEPSKFIKRFYSYKIQATHDNVICICARKETAAAACLPRISSLAGLELHSSYLPQQCPEA